jgi:cyclic beta-1,2-glucan synthetase
MSMPDTSLPLIPYYLGQVRDSLSDVIKRASEVTSFTPEPDAPWRAEVLSRDEIGTLATDLARQHRDQVAILPGRRLLQRYTHNRATLERVYKSLSDAAQKGEPLTAGAEWLLDNYHVVERHAVAIKKYLPPGYYKTLPRFKSGELRGFPRIYQLALEFIIHTDAVVEPQFATHFISSYQKELELGSGELWAFSIMLRFALLENLCRLTREAEKELFSRREAFEVVDAVLGNDARTGTEIMVDLAARLNERASFFPYGALEMMKRLRARGRKAYLALQFLEEALKERGCEPEELLRAEDHNQAARQISVGNTLTSLTSIDQIDWRSWFEEVSVVHHIFERDPSHIYKRSDFETRDRLRHRVEQLARLSKAPESAVAQKAIDLASTSEARESDSPDAALVRCYVGSFLQGPGREALEGVLGIHLPLTTSIRRWGVRHVVPVYLTLIALVTVFFLLYLAGLASFADERWWVVLIAVLLFILPASEFASNLVQYLATRAVPPRPLPKLEFEGSIPAELKTAITVHTIFSNTAGIERAIDALEVRYLGNDDPAFTYILLADLPDSKAETAAGDETLIMTAVEGITRLNLRHSRVDGTPEGTSTQDSRAQLPFMLFFRRRLWNSGEGKWMGWERKRGKIEEFNRFLLGDRETTLTLHVGEPEQLLGVRYVITLDSDSQLPREVGKKLVATAAHPVNRPVFDEQNGRVVSGYGLIQPRVTISLTSATASRFSELFSGHAGLDPYTNVVSDVYQDLFGEGSFFGKAIYDVEVFERALKNRVPENALLSHDLFEGLFVRVGLASDIEVYDDFPSRYMAYAKRLHRWVRGDWQLFPWTLPTVPSKTGKIPNPLTTLGLWKILDNLRRGLLPPACFLALLCGWAFLPGDAWGWTALILLVISFPVFTGLASVFALPTLGLSIGGLIEGVGKDLWRASARAACAVCFLPHQATLMVHAMCVTLYRLFVSRKNLLEWEPAEQTEKRARTEQRAFLQLFIPSFSLAVATVVYVGFFRQEALPFALPFLLLWGASPLISKWLSKPIEQGVSEVSPEDATYLRKAAFETWMFFDDYLVERYHYLMPDNLQLVPREVVAERTSPTNISLSMLSCISAYDLGFTPLHRAIHRVGLTVATIAKLEKYRGHLFNWYNISTLEPLNPRYISTVDSGNLLGHLYTLESVLSSCGSLPLVTASHRETLQQLGAELLGRSPNGQEQGWQAVSSLQSKLLSCDSGTLNWVCEVIKNRDLIAEIQDLSSRTTDDNATALHRYAKALSEISLLEELVPWAVHLREFITIADSQAFSSGQPEASPLQILVAEARGLLSKLNSDHLSVPQLRALSNRLSSMLVQMLSEVSEQGGNNDAKLLLQVISTSLHKGEAKLTEFEGGVAWISGQLKRLISEMDFSFLYDDYRKLFTIGFNAEHARRDTSFYDLLASEARLLSFLAVARGEVAQKHWFALGRALTSTSGGKALLSWSGTMFEYLMPFIVMRDYRSTLLGRSARAVVRAQMDYCRRQRVPWGISESAYSGVDFEKTYQYRAFGVPGLGLKRGLSYDLVVSPYSTFLALEFAPTVHAAVENLKALEKKGARGRYGFYESVDFTTSRVARTQDHHTVASFFAHHQGMSLVSVDNLLNGNIMQDRLHAQPIVKSAELLLHERFPERIDAIVPHEPEVESVVRVSDPPSVSGLDVTTTPHTLSPRVRVLSNGRYSVMVDSSGGGFSSFDRTQQLTRWKEDPTCTPYGSFVYIREPATSKLWSSAHQPTRVEADSYEAIFSPGRVEFKRFDHQLFTHTEITVAPEDDVELRRVTITNLGNSKRTIEVISYLEPTLATRRADASHPAFSKLFVRTEVLSDSDALLCTRRPRSEHESSLFFFHRVTLRTSYAPVVFHTSRSDFIGRGHTLENPQALAGQRHNTTGAESHVDPILGLQVTIDLEPGTAETVVFVSGAARVREEALGLIERYQELMHISRAFELAWSRAQVELRNHAYSAGQADMFHRLAGCLFYSEPSVRGNSQTIQTNRLSQSGLWRFGISGDLPIVLAKINNPKQVKVLQELLLAHHFLRERGLELDLVILHHYPGGYMQQLAEELEYTVRSSPGGQLLDRPGGIFLRSTTQVSEAEGVLLETVARVVVDADIGGLAEVLKSAAFDQMVPVVPRSTRQRPKFSWIRPPEPLRLANPLGGFSPSGRQYILPRVGTLRPPVPWSNVIANQDFGFLVTESGSGYTWSENSRENRLTSWSNDPVLDPASEAVFLRDADSGDYWSLTPAPAGDGLEYRVEHGFGYSEFSTAARSIESVLTLSGATTDRVKWYGITLTNHDSDERKIDLFFYVDLVLGVSRDESYRYVVTSFDRTTQTLCAVNHYNNEFAGRVVSVGSSEPITGYSGSRLEFLGRNGELGRPLALERAAMLPFFMAKPRPAKLSGKTGAGFDPCGALHISVTLQPREQREVCFFLSESPTFEEARRSSLRYRSLHNARHELNATRAAWQDLVGAIQVETPSESTNILLNGWLLYQTVACRLLGRSAFYQSGGALGFRDQLQDSLALLPTKPELVRDQIILHAHRQFREGDVQHWWHPPTGRGVRTRITDDLLWLPYAIARYIERTDDYSILDQEVPFLDGPVLQEDQMENYFVPTRSHESATVLEHCLRTFKATERTGPHGLPLMGAGDWNDGMNEVGRHGKGESVWLAWFQIEVIKRFAPVLEKRGLSEAAELLRERSTAFAQATETHAWDGHWYRRAYYDDGTPIGSSESGECTIDSLSQSWAVISGAASEERRTEAMQAVCKLLVDQEGGLIKVLTPPFDKTPKNPGYIKGYPPGIRENGGQYTHAAAWVIIATAQMGLGSEAAKLFEMINPIEHTLTPAGIECYKAEPYVLCGDVYSEGDLTGRAGWSWYTGSSGWLYQAGIESILGLRVSSDFFRLHPALPKEWEAAKISVVRGSRTFDIEIKNPSKVAGIVKKVSVNGTDLPDLTVRWEAAGYGERVVVVAVIG